MVLSGTPGNATHKPETNEKLNLKSLFVGGDVSCRIKLSVDKPEAASPPSHHPARIAL